MDNLLRNEVEFVGGRQVINMGGPWIGDLMFKSKLVARECLLDNYVFDDQGVRLFYVKYHLTSNKMSGVYFTINFYLVEEQRTFQSEKHFETLFLKNIVKDELEYFEAFHDKIEKYRRCFDLNERFMEVNS